MFSTRRLGAGDEALLERLAREDAAFDVEGRSDAQTPLSPEAAAAYLADPSVLHFVTEEHDALLGFLLCHVLRLRAGAGREVLLYEIGVRQEHRRRGVGRALMDALARWMHAEDVDVIWVLADNPVAVDFYRATGFTVQAEQPVYLTRGED